MEVCDCLLECVIEMMALLSKCSNVFMLSIYIFCNCTFPLQASQANQAQNDSFVYNKCVVMKQLQTSDTLGETE